MMTSICLASGATNELAIAGLNPCHLRQPAEVHHFIENPGPKFVIDLDSTIVFREQLPLSKFERFRLMLSGQYHNLSQTYSYDCFEGRPLIMEGGNNAYRVFFRRGVTRLLTRLGSLGKIVIASHAGPGHVHALVSFLERHVATVYGIVAMPIPRWQLKFVVGDVRFILDDKPERWMKETRSAVTKVMPFDGTTVAHDCALHLVMLQNPALFPKYNPRGLRTILQSPLLSQLAPAWVDGVLLDLVQRNLRPVLPIRMCRPLFCGAYKHSSPNALCDLCETGDAESPQTKMPTWIEYFSGIV